MTFWHIQMMLPFGPKGERIDSKPMLQQHPSIIGCGKWDNHQSVNFSGKEKQTLQIGDIVLVREGSAPIALCRIEGPVFEHVALQKKFKHDIYREVEVLDWYTGTEKFPQPRGTLQPLRNQTASRTFVENWYKSWYQLNTQSTYQQVLSVKKQLILHGPPGTGKTRLAHEIAREVVFEKSPVFTPIEIGTYLSLGTVINSPTGYNTFKIVEKTERLVVIYPRGAKNMYRIPYEEIATCIREGKTRRPVADGDVNGNSSYIVGLALFVEDQYFHEQTKLVQFHPSYNYEDFVRGISVSAEQGTVAYETQNRVFAQLASAAHQNFVDAKKEPETITQEKWVEDQFLEFVDWIDEELLRKKNKVQISDSAHIYDIAPKAFRYTGENWNSNFTMPFDDLLSLYNHGIVSRQQIKKDLTVSGRARQHATYFKNVLKEFQDFIEKKELPNVEHQKVPRKNYVLIVDEINRANLSSVLGELIYGLEYRNMPVESIYEIDGQRNLIIPENLYIIGTMNTADRSVGHIDYAIRRRFAFIAVPPDRKVVKDIAGAKALSLFDRVQALFVDEHGQRSEYMSLDFEPRDVAIGHSYFLEQADERLQLRLAYEIKPILQEYIKDGILKPTASKVVDEL